MTKLVLFGIIALLLLSPAGGVTVLGGDGSVVNGRGSEGIGSHPPVLDGYSQTHNPREPSTYVVPGTPVPKPSDEESSNSNSAVSFTETGGSSGVTFTMMGEVKGHGSFSTWKILVGEGKSQTPKVDQRASALSGDLTDSSLTIYATDKLVETNSYDVRFIRSSNKILFVGDSYSEFTNVASGKDRIFDSYRAGAINKSSSYTTLFTNVTEEEPESDFAYSKTIYRYIDSQISSRFVGMHSFHARINESEIEQEFVGRMAEERKMSSESLCNITKKDDVGLDCCINQGEVTSYP